MGDAIVLLLAGGVWRATRADFANGVPDGSSRRPRRRGNSELPVSCQDLRVGVAEPGRGPAEYPTAIPRGVKPVPCRLGQVGASHQIPIALPRRTPPLIDGPHDQTLAAPTIPRGEHPADVGRE